MSNSSNSLPIGEVQFYDGFEPGLKDGTYQIDVEQTLSATDATITSVSQKFVVQGPRFALNPSDIHAVFPPNGATSVFEEILPHVVLSKRLLPWERTIPPFPNTVPWLALLVFSEGELIGPGGGGNYAQTLTVTQLIATDSNTRKPIFPVQPTGDDLALSCQAITFGSALFAQIAPTAAELPYLSHVRNVNTGDKANLDLKDDGWFSVVIANRFPQAGTAAAASKSIVHLVSLEGFGDLLSGTSPIAPTQPQIQLVSLANWTFSCLADPSQTFGGLAQNLAYDLDALRPAASLLLSLPFTPTAATDPGTVAVQQRLTAGYVALGYHAPSGEDGFAWYRGPFSPVVSNNLPNAGAFQTADAATIYDPTTGVFDLSLATAWQAGRSLALASQSYAIALMRARIAINATLEQLSAPSTATIHTQLATLFSGGAIQTVGQASTAGSVAPLASSETASAAVPPVMQLRALLAQPDVLAQLTAQAQTDTNAQSVAGWLGQLLLLRNVPFVHLVPDARMLPMESIRFFYLDPNWLGAMLAGALSVGLGSSRESAVQTTFTQQLEQMAQTAALAWRADQLGQAPPAAAAGPTAGFLLRSALAAGWPGLGISGSSNGAPVQILRLEHIGSNVMICLFNGVPDTVILSEPHEGLVFGVDDSGDVTTRTIDPPVITNGTPLHVFDPANPAVASTAIRSGGQRVLNVSSDPSPPAGTPSAPLDLLEQLAQALKVAPSAIGPADFAVQMVKGPEQLVFSLAPPTKPI